MMAKVNEYLKLHHITGAQLYVLMLLWENEGREMTQKQMYNVMEIKPPSLTKLIIQLEKKGYISRKTNPEDKRYSIIMLTRTGTQLRGRTLEFADEFNGKLFNGISDDEVATMKTVIMKLQENLSKM
mgnify:CR=1 FL=1